MLDSYVGIEWVMCYQREDTISFKEMKNINLQKAGFKGTPNIKVKEMRQNFIPATKNGNQLLLWSPCACTHASGRAPNEKMDGVRMNVLPDRHQCNTELLGSLKCNLATSNGPKHNIPEVFFWTSSRPDSGINSFILQELPAYSSHMRPGIVVH